MKQLLTANCVGCKHVASVTSNDLKLGIVALGSTLAEHVRTEHPEWGEKGAQAAREYVHRQAEAHGWVQPDPEREKAAQRQRDRAMHLDQARAELSMPLAGEAIRQHREQLKQYNRLVAGQGEQGLPPEQGGTSDVKTGADLTSGLGGSSVIQEFIRERADYITAIENAGNGPDYHRWQGHAEARRQLAERLGLAP